MKIELIPNWRRAHRMLTTWVNGVGAAFAASWPLLPEDQQVKVLAVLKVSPAYYVMALFLLSMLVRVIRQASVSGDNPK